MGQQGRETPLQKSFADQVVEHSDKLLHYARKLARQRSLADDLLQETILRALVHADQFRPGTNLIAWLFTIMRNAFYNEIRRTKHHAPLGEDVVFGDQSPTATDQIWAVEAKEVFRHLERLPSAQREAIVRIALDGDTYEAAAQKVGCRCGTMKSRVSRGRAALLEALNTEQAPPSCEVFFRRDLEHLDGAA
jgi:RNA polymerase sigma-70 factor (ECF subfamily)